MLVLKELQRNNEIYSTLRDRIIFVEYEPGRSISEQKMAQEFNCSRVPIREALILLKVEGLVTVVANQGSYVSRMDLRYLKNNFMIRSKLVKILGKLATENIKQEEIDQLNQIVSRMGEKNDYTALMRLDYQFHQVLHEAANNEWLSGILDMLLGHAVRSWIINSGPGEDRGTPFIRSNFQQLTDALEHGEVNRSANLLVEHVQFSLKSLDDFIEGLSVV